MTSATKKKPRPRPRRGQKVLSTHISGDLYERVRLLVVGLDTTVSEFTRRALEDAIVAYRLEAAVSPPNNSEEGE